MVVAYADVGSFRGAAVTVLPDIPADTRAPRYQHGSQKPPASCRPLRDIESSARDERFSARDQR